MQKTIYICDQCNKPIGTNFHVSLGLNKGLSGIAVPPNLKTSDDDVMPSSHWRVEPVPSGFVHFHVICIGKFFEKMAAKSIKRNFPDVLKPKKLNLTKKHHA
jgi:hypothetical protein